jgi:hypothetical protein
MPMTDDDELGWSIQTTATKTSESVWIVKQKLRAGTYRAVKSGRRTIVLPASVRAAFEKLPAAQFAPPRRRKIA